MPELFVDHKYDLLEIESGSTNKFRWYWLLEKDDHGDFLSEYVRKIPEPGVAYCIYCKKRLNYGSKGKSFITRHSNSKSHTAKRNAVKSNQSLPTTFQSNLESDACVPVPVPGWMLMCPGPAVPSTSTSSCPLPYGVAPNGISTVLPVLKDIASPLTTTATNDMEDVVKSEVVSDSGESEVLGEHSDSQRERADSEMIPYSAMHELEGVKTEPSIHDSTTYDVNVNHKQSCSASGLDLGDRATCSEDASNSMTTHTTGDQNTPTQGLPPVQDENQCLKLEEVETAPLVPKQEVIDNPHTNTQKFHDENTYKTLVDQLRELAKDSIPVHKKVVMTSVKKKTTFKCTECGREFPCIASLQNHILYRERDTPYECPTCGKRFCVMLALRQHVREHSRGKPHKYKCKTRGQSFSDLTTLQRHKTKTACSKSKERQSRFQYNVNVKTFSRFGLIQAHTKTHSKDELEIPLKCFRCARTFTMQSHLERHMKSHRGDRPFKCAVCDKQFSYHTILKRHIKTRHPQCSSVPAAPSSATHKNIRSRTKKPKQLKKFTSPFTAELISQQSPPPPPPSKNSHQFLPRPPKMKARKAYQMSVLHAFIKEHYLPPSIALHLVQLGRQLSMDLQALNSLTAHEIRMTPMP